MAELKKRKYFIKDTSVNEIDDDLFNYADISKVLECILESNDPPYNIAVIGKWGLGKSSLINLVKNKLSGDSTYLIQEINAWKYEKESLRRVFLKQLWQGISGEKLKSFQEIQRIFSDLINNEISQEKPPVKPPVKPKWYIPLKNGLWKLGRNLRKYCLPALGIVLFTIIAFIFYKLIQAHTENVVIDALFWWKVVLSYCKNIGVTLLLPVLIALLTALHNEYRKKEPKSFELKFPLETADDYELFLESAITDKLKDNSDLKIVTIIDDLDRLSLDKIVEALDSIKAFVNLSNCVFIVPFDDEIIKSALEKRRETQFGQDCEVIESELILDKLFQFKVYLPPLLKYDIGDYAMKLIKREIPNFIDDYCPEKILNRLVKRIIIHSDVSTPRQVKKLVNAFVNNFLIAHERVESGRVEKELFTGERGMEQIAILSVLQADFNHFYDLLFKDFAYITRFVDIVQSRCAKSDVPLELRGYFKYDNDTGADVVVGVLRTHEPLLDFLYRTAKCGVENIAPFYYLAQDAIGIKTGDEHQRRAIAALESGNDSTLQTMVSEKPEIAEAIISFVSDCTDAELPLQAAYPVLDIVDEQYKVPLANALVERSIEADTNMGELSLSLSPDNVLYVAQQAEREEHSTILVERYLSAIADEKNTNWIAIVDVLKIFIPEYKALSSDAQGAIKRATQICCHKDEISVNNVLPLLDYTDGAMFETLWGVDWFGKLCAHISDENDYKQDIISALKESFGILATIVDFSSVSNCVLPLFKLPPLLEYLNAMFTEELCSKLNETQSTQIAEALIVHEYDKNTKTTQILHEMLSKLNYVVDTDNADAMTKFTANYTTSELMDDVLVYMGKNGFFPHIETTLISLVNAVFTDDSNDGLLRKVSAYLTETVREELFKLLNQRSQFTSGKDYARELAVISVLSADSNNTENIENLATTTLMSQFASRYNQPLYFDFIAKVMGTIKGLLQQATIDDYVDKLVNYFASQRPQCLSAFEHLSGKISKERFVNVFPLVTNDIADSEFEQALKIIIDNDEVRPTESNDLSIYRKFLISHLGKTANPNMVLQALKNSFGYFSGIKELTTSALNNSATDKNLLVDVIAQCFNNYEKADKVADEALPMFDNTQEFVIFKEAFIKLSKHPIDDAFAALSAKLSASTSIDTLVNIAEYAVKGGSTQARDLYLKALILGLERDNVPDKSIKIITALSGLNKDIRNTARDDFNKALLTGFIKTTSTSIQGEIVRIVKSCGWTRSFKKLLENNTDKLDMFNKLAK